MARRKSTEVGLNLDSLLDTLTNVIGFLLIMLVLLQLGMSQAIERIREIDPTAFSISEADVEKSEERAKQRSEEIVESQQEAEALSEEMALLKDPSKATDADVIPLDQAKQQLTDVKSKVDEKEKEQKIKQAEVARLKERMGRTPRKAAPPPNEIRMPDPRGAPAGSSAMWVMCKDDGVTMIDVDLVRAEIKKRLKDPRARAALMKKTLGGAAQGVYDPDKVRDLFRQKPYKTRDYAAQVKTFDNRASANIEIAMLPGGGEDIKQMKRATSKFRRTLKTAKEKNKYIRFLVYPDSFEAYLTARSITDQANVAAGWEIFRRNSWEMSLGGDIKIFQKKKPPPRPKTTAKPAPKKKAPPPRVID
jgi:membrane-associated HD superfamily phosphohydrolase